MKAFENEDLGKLLLRLMVAGLMLFHGFGKLMHGVGFIQKILMDAGLPGFLAYGLYVAEVIVPILLILGIRVKLSALVIIFAMLNAIVLVHLNDIFALTPHGAWAIEIPMFYLLSSLAIIFLGAGKYTILNCKKDN